MSDDGPGFSEADRRARLRPVLLGRQAGRGLGFGLPKCWRIVTLHGGTLRVRSRPGATVFRVGPADAPPPIHPPTDRPPPRMVPSTPASPLRGPGMASAVFAFVR